MKLVKPVIATFLSASAAGCLIETEQLAGPAAAPADLAAKYDASWYKSDYWTGEYPDGFATTRNVTVKIREILDPAAPRTVSCALRKGATYHPWNEARVASDQLEFVTFSKIETYELKEDFKDELERKSDGRDVPIELHKGDRWLYLAGVQEDIFMLRVGGTDYVASGAYLLKISTQVDPRIKSKQSPDDEWMKLKCANGAVGWIFANEIAKAPGVSRYTTDSYGHAYDAETAPKSRASNK
jgi:hypothetical protein